MYEFINSLESSLTWIENLSSNTLIAFTTILLTVLIPLFIAQLNSDSAFKGFDIQVILDYILKFKKFLLFIVLSFIFALVFDLPLLDTIKIIFFLSWICFNIFIIRKLLNFYEWIKGEVPIESSKWDKSSKNAFRLSYLKEIKNDKDLELAYRAIWEAKNINTPLESQIWKSFRIKVDALIEKKNFPTVANLLLDFKNNLQNRNDYGVLIFLESIFNWYCILCKLNKEDKSNSIEIGKSLSYLSNAIIDIEHRAIENKLISMFYFHVKEPINRLIENYIEEINIIFKAICQKIFENANTYDIFDGFSEEWKITTERVGNNEILPHIWFNEFFVWVRRRIFKETKEALDPQTETIAMNLFPNIDTSLLSDFIILLFSYEKEHPLEWAMKVKWGFGKISSPIVAVRASKEQLADANEFFFGEFEKRKNEAIQLISELVKNSWLYNRKIVEAILNNCLKDLEQLKSKITKESPEDFDLENYSHLIRTVLKEIQT